MKDRGIIFDIKRFAVHDGPGIRTTIFFKGCPLNCWWCHNPEGQKAEPEKMKRNQGHGHSIRFDLVGKEMSVRDVMAEINKEIIFYDESGGGVTFSGGEPLMQPEFLDQLLDECKSNGIHTAIDTSGYSPPGIFQKIVQKADLILFDLKILNSNLHRKYTGVPNDVIMENLKNLAATDKRIFLRFAVIPGITDTPSNISEIGELIQTLGPVEQINILPYHPGARGKYKRLNKKYLLPDIDPPADTWLDSIKNEFSSYRINVITGG